MLTRHNNLKISKGENPRNLHGIGHPFSIINRQVTESRTSAELEKIGSGWSTFGAKTQMVMKNKKVLEFLAFVWITSAEDIH